MTNEERFNNRDEIVRSENMTIEELSEQRKSLISQYGYWNARSVSGYNQIVDILTRKRAEEKKYNLFDYYTEPSEG